MGDGNLRVAEPPSDCLSWWLRLEASGHPALVIVDDEKEETLVATVDGVSAEEPRLSARQTTVLRLVSRGLTNAEVAYELSISEGAVRHALRAGLRRIGLRRRVDLVRLAHGATRRSTMRRDGREVQVLRASARPAPTLPSLSAAERRVLALVRRGLTNQEIADARGVSMRTVANQVGSVLRKYGVATREELICRSSAPPSLAVA